MHLLHPGHVRVGRSADADVPLDDPDVSRLHCELTVGGDGRVTVADPGSTNGTALEGRPVGPRPVPPVPRGAAQDRRVGPAPVRRRGRRPPAHHPGRGGPGPRRAPGRRPRGGRHGSGRADGAVRLRRGPERGGLPRPAPGTAPPGTPPSRAPPERPGTGGRGTRTTPPGTAGTPPRVPARSRAPPAGAARTTAPRCGTGATPGRPRPGADHDRARGGAPHDGPDAAGPEARGAAAHDPGDAAGALPGGGPAPGEPARRRGIGAWARRLAGGRGDRADRAAPDGPDGPDGPDDGAAAPDAPRGPGAGAWPDPAAVLLTALGPGPRLWERAPDHPEALAVRLGTTDRADLAAVPVTVGLREAGALGLAGPRARLLGLARSVVAQAAALHAPADLEVVLIGADPDRPLEERRRDWAWLGWLPHVRPAHGQDCRLLLAYDRDQAAARVAELARRLDDGAAEPAPGPYTLVVVDGDPGTEALREAVVRLAGAGAAAGVHLVCLAETAPATAVFPVAAAYEAACAAAPAFRECGAVGLLTGEVATAVRVMRTAGGRPAGHGTVAAVDAVSPAWAERFARALAPLRADGPERRGRTAAAALPPSSRLLDELELARATPASLMARWASAPDGTAVLGAGPHGPVGVDLTGADGPHLLVEGPVGSGRTELLRSVAASLAAASRPDRLGLLLVDGAGGERGDGLGPCADLPHVTEHLVASDPVRMRAFARALGAELKRRAELLGREGLADWSARGDGRPDAPPADRAVPGQRGGGPAPGSDRTPRPRARRGRRAGRGRGAGTAPPRGAGRRPGRAGRARARQSGAPGGRFGRAGAGGRRAGRRAAGRPPGGGDGAPGAHGRDGTGAEGADPGRAGRAARAAGPGRPGARPGAGAPRRRAGDAVPGGPGERADPPHGDAAPHGRPAGVGAHGRPAGPPPRAGAGQRADGPGPAGQRPGPGGPLGRRGAPAAARGRARHRRPRALTARHERITIRQSGRKAVLRPRGARRRPERKDDRDDAHGRTEETGQ
ncbi:FHA domain-containing protein [Streptomyces somaliensis]|nr:FHA domain-containing protein [Streptomyces somaliensis]